MVLTSFLASLLTVVIGVQALAHPNNTIPGSYIVEYEDGQEASGVLNSIGAAVSTRMTFNYTLFRGISIQFDNVHAAEENAAMLAALPAVKRVWPNKLYSVPRHTVHWTSGDVDNRRTARRQVANASDVFSPHVMTQVHQLRDAGYVGKGIKVAIIDTGVDYRHPALGGCFGEGCLVSFGYDLVGNAFDGSNEPNPDSDPFDCNGHGSHVSGIVAAQTNNPFGIIGAATGVELGMFRVFGCEGNSPDDILIDALNRAYEAGADIITASIGGAAGWSEEPWSVAAQRIVENGVPCTLSAGNDGVSGIFYSSTAANGKQVTAIASVDNTLSPTMLIGSSFTVDGVLNKSYGFTAGDLGTWANTSLPLYALSYNTSNATDACDALPADVPDLSNYIVLIRRGTCTFELKLANVAARGAKYVIFYNNESQGSIVVDSGAVPAIAAVAMVDAVTGAEWIQDLGSGSKVVVDLPDPVTSPFIFEEDPNYITGGFMSTYTSWGPTFEAEIKPQLATPGGMILSTYPTVLGSYAVLSGASMACPLAAAIYALIMEARQTKDPQTIENLLTATSKPNVFHNGSIAFPYLAPVAQQGAGLVQAYDAAFATTLLSTSKLEFNDTDHFVHTHNFTVANYGSLPITYNITNIGAATAYTFGNDTDVYPSLFPNEMVTQHAELAFFPGTFTLGPGEEQEITVIPTQPTELDAKRLPVWSGYIAINGTDNLSLSLPYLGIGGSLHSVAVLAVNTTYLYNSTSYEAVLPNATFVLPPPGEAENQDNNSTDVSLPVINVDLAFGSALVRVDVVAMSNQANITTTDVAGLTTMGSVYDTPLLYSSRNSVSSTWLGRLQDGTYVPAGAYKLVVRALRVFGDPTLASEYDVVETIVFNIRYATKTGESNETIPK